jgi:hypothetical protein
MCYYAYIDLQLAERPGHALMLREYLPQEGGRLTLRDGSCWDVVLARYGFRRFDGVEGTVVAVRGS